VEESSQKCYPALLCLGWICFCGFSFGILHHNCQKGHRFIKLVLQAIRDSIAFPDLGFFFSLFFLLLSTLCSHPVLSSRADQGMRVFKEFGVVSEMKDQHWYWL